MVHRLSFQTLASTAHTWLCLPLHSWWAWLLQRVFPAIPSSRSPPQCLRGDLYAYNNWYSKLCLHKCNRYCLPWAAINFLVWKYPWLGQILKMNIINNENCEKSLCCLFFCDWFCAITVRLKSTIESVKFLIGKTNYFGRWCSINSHQYMKHWCTHCHIFLHHQREAEE